MLESVGRQLADGNITSDAVNEVAEEMSLHLATLRNSGEISNDAFLEAGVIQGGISVLANMIDTECNSDELMVHFKQLSDRANTICQSYPELSETLA